MHVVVGNKDANILVLQFGNYLLYIANSNGVNTSKGFVEQDKLRVDSKCSGDLSTATFSSRKLYPLALAYMSKAELLKQFLAPLLLVVLGEVGHFKYSLDIVLNTEVAEYAGFLSQIADTFLSPLVHRFAGDKVLI